MEALMYHENIRVVFRSDDGTSLVNVFDKWSHPPRVGEEATVVIAGLKWPVVIERELDPGEYDEEEDHPRRTFICSNKGFRLDATLLESAQREGWRPALQSADDESEQRFQAGR